MIFSLIFFFQPSVTAHAPRPALPAKPSHLGGKPVSSAIVDRHVQKVTPTKNLARPGAMRDSVRSSPARSQEPGALRDSVRSSPGRSQEPGALRDSVRSSPGRSQEPGALRDSVRSSPGRNGGLVKASVATVIPSDSKELSRSKELGSASIQLNLHPIKADSDAEGVKRVSSSSIQNIRNSGNHVNFKFDDKKGPRNHLPGLENKKTLPPKQVRKNS